MKQALGDVQGAEVDFLDAVTVDPGKYQDLYDIKQMKIQSFVMTSHVHRP